MAAVKLGVGLGRSSARVGIPDTASEVFMNSSLSIEMSLRRKARARSRPLKVLERLTCMLCGERVTGSR
ncbi:hypothetical protein D3C72_791300 [compost metagenome]